MKTILILSILIAALAFGHHARAHSIFPSVHELQAALHLSPGQPLPQLVVVDGHVFQPKYVKAEEHGNGDYSVHIHLDRNK